MSYSFLNFIIKFFYANNNKTRRAHHSSHYDFVFFCFVLFLPERRRGAFVRGHQGGLECINGIYGLETLFFQRRPRRSRRLLRRSHYALGPAQSDEGIKVKSFFLPLGTPRGRLGGGFPPFVIPHAATAACPAKLGERSGETRDIVSKIFSRFGEGFFYPVKQSRIRD